MHPEANFAPYGEMIVTIRLLAVSAVRKLRKVAGLVVGVVRSAHFPAGKRTA